MKVCVFNPVIEKGNCILRSLTKILEKDYFEVKNELNNLTKKLNCEDYRDEKVFLKYLGDSGFIKVDSYNGVSVRDLKLDSGKYVVICGKDDYYHMFSVVNGIIYDKDESCYELKVIDVYKLEK